MKSTVLEDALFEVKRVVVGQDRMIERLFVCLLAEGHCLLEGAPGLAIPDTVVASNAATVADSVATAPVRTVPAEVAAGDSAPLTQVTEKNLEIFTAGLPEGAQGLAIPDTVVPSNVATVSESVAVASGNDKDTTMNIDDRAPEVESSKTDDRGRTHGVAHIKAE